MANQKTSSQFVICINNAEYPASLELHKIYRTLPNEESREEGDIRIVDESGEDYLYPAEYFLAVNLPQTIAHALNKSFPRPLAGAPSR
jgi:hypothetical protein